MKYYTLNAVVDGDGDAPDETVEHRKSGIHSAVCLEGVLYLRRKQT